MELTSIPKKVTFVDAEQQTINNNSKQIPLSESSRKCDNQTEQIGLFQQTPKSILMSGTSIDVQSTQPGRYKRGLNAQFLRDNPRYLHEPVCHVLPNETASSVGECLVWSRQRDKGEQRKVTCSLDSTSRSDYRPLSGDQKPPPLRKYVTHAKARGIVPLTNVPASSSKVTERISYRHLYNCRTDPNEPIRGKLLGSFVWKPVL